MKRFASLAVHPLLLVIVHLLGGGAVLITLYVVSAALLFTGIHLGRSEPVYLSGLVSVLVLTGAVFTGIVFTPMLVVSYSSALLISVELALEGLGDGYLNARWPQAGMRSRIFLRHALLMVTAFVLSLVLVDVAQVFRVISSNMVLILILALSVIGGLLIHTKISASREYS